MTAQKNSKFIDTIIKDRGFVWGPSPEIYGGVAGFYDYGPYGALLKSNVISVLEDSFQEHGFYPVITPIIMPRKVWEASGHLERFADPVTYCKKCKRRYRADKLLESKKIHIADYSPENLTRLIREHNVRCQACGGELSDVSMFNLMLRTDVAGEVEAYLRPETATTVYLLFPRLYILFRQKLPIKIYQYGYAFRNEISPRRGLLRLRELTQFEAQIFLLERQKKHYDEFKEMEKLRLPFLSAERQESSGKVEWFSLSEALDSGIIHGEAYGWAFGISWRITQRLGYPQDKIRYRQHLPTEKAHYAHDAWDLEVDLTDYGWTEVCGVHDRGNYDLSRHSKFANKSMLVDNETPSIIEIAFGPDRLTYALLDLSLIVEEKRIYFKFNSCVAPIKVGIFPLHSNSKEQLEIAKRIYNTLRANGIKTILDRVGHIGRRYHRADSIGIPWCVTVDKDSLVNNTVTIRDRNTKEQVRVKVEDVPVWIKEKLNI